MDTKVIETHDTEQRAIDGCIYLLHQYGGRFEVIGPNKIGKFEVVEVDEQLTQTS